MYYYYYYYLHIFIPCPVVCSSLLGDLTWAVPLPRFPHACRAVTWPDRGIEALCTAFVYRLSSFHAEGLVRHFLKVNHEDDHCLIVCQTVCLLIKPNGEHKEVKKSRGDGACVWLSAFE